MPYHCHPFFIKTFLILLLPFVFVTNKTHQNVYKLIIIGSGPAGFTAGIYAGRAQLKPLIFEGDKPGGQLTSTTYIENWPGEPHILGFALMRSIAEHAQLSGCTLISETVIHVDFKHRPFTIWTDTENTYQAESIIIATGSTPRSIGCPGEDQYWGRGVSSCVTCDGALYRDKKVIVVGGGDTGMEYASFLAKYTKEITIIQDLPELTASAPMQQRVLSNPHTKIIYNSLITEMRGDDEHLTAIVITNQKTNEQTVIETDGIFLAIGHIPTTELFKGYLKLDRYGYINVENQIQTSIEGLFAAGDVVDPRYRQAITSAGSGCMAALAAERYLIEAKKHRYIFAKNPF